MLAFRLFLIALSLAHGASRGKPPKAPTTPPVTVNFRISLPQTEVPTTYNISLSVSPKKGAPVLVAVEPAGAPALASLSQPEKSAAALFDNAQGKGRAAFSAAPRELPPGISAVIRHKIWSADDMERALAGTHSAGYAEKLMRMAPQMPFMVDVYIDGRGQRFAAIDLSSKPQLVDVLPQIYDHEARMIKKIMGLFSEVQVLLPEAGDPTPDLLVDGVVLEMKSIQGAKNPNLKDYIKDANSQIKAHAKRHGLGPGIAAIDCTGSATPMTPSLAARQVEHWGQHPMTPNRRILVNKIILFLKKDMRVFVRRADGSFQPEIKAKPLAFWGGLRWAAA